MTARPERALPLAGLVIGAWAVLPPYLGPGLATDDRVEVIDHVVPGLAVLALCAAVLAAGRRLAKGATLMFSVGLGIVLAGLWMVATHVPVVAQASRGEAPRVATAWHFVPGVVVTVFGAIWALRQSTTPPGPLAPDGH